MIRSKKFFDPTQLGVGVTTLYTVPANFRATIKQATATNTTATARTVTIHLVPSGGTATATNMIVSAKTIPPTGQGNVSLSDLLCNQVLNEGDTIQALASAATAIGLTMSGFEETV